MKGGFFFKGGSSANNEVQKTLIENLCIKTKSGGSLEAKDGVASSHRQNLCRNNAIHQSPANPLSGGNSAGNYGFMGKVFLLVTAPIRIALNILGKVTGFSVESATPLNNAIAVQQKPIINAVAAV